MARKKKEKEKDIINQMLDNIDFRGLTQDDTGRILRRTPEAEMTEHLGY